MLDNPMLLDRRTDKSHASKGQMGLRAEITENRPKGVFPTVDWSSFRASRYVRGGHLQTILGSYWPNRLPLPPLVKHLAPTTHGDYLVFYDSCPPQWTHGDRVVLLIHGLGGSADSPYIRRMAARYYDLGIRALRMNLRGAGEGFSHARQIGHAGRSEDIAAALQFIAEQAPESPVAAVGYSMGGNLLLKHFGECGEPHPQVDRVLCVAPPIDLVACMKNMLFRDGWVYDRAFVKRLHQMAKRREKELPGAPHRPLSKRVRRLLDFDDHYTAPLSGFQDAFQYYEYASSKNWIEKIRTRTTIVAADDDPLIPISIFEHFKGGDCVELHITRSGGHLGYLGARSSDPDGRWLDWRILEWTSSLLP